MKANWLTNQQPARYVKLKRNSDNFNNNSFTGENVAVKGAQSPPALTFVTGGVTNVRITSIVSSLVRIMLSALTLCTFQFSHVDVRQNDIDQIPYQK